MNTQPDTNPGTRHNGNQTAMTDGAIAELDTSIEEARWLFAMVGGMAFVVFGSGFAAALIGA